MKGMDSQDTDDRLVLTVQVARFECPALFGELMKVPKGKMRASRFRMLAEKGLMIEGGPAWQVVPLPSPATTVSIPGAYEPAPLEAVSQMFSDPDEE